MSDKSDSKTEQHEDETPVNLFAEDFDDKSLMGEPADPGPEDDEKKDDAKGDNSEDGVPEKYRGKSLKDVIEMHREVERAYGRGQNELGELRKLTDQILQQQLGEDKAAERKQLDADELLENPNSAIDAAVEGNSKVRELEAKLTARERADQLAAFNRRHPNAAQLVADPRFIQWVQESPTRQRLLQQADQTLDYELASEVISLYEDSHPQEKGDSDKDALTNAKPSAGNRSGGKKPVFKRSEIMRLKLEDPDRYEKLQPQIMEAYADKRVR